MFLATISIVLSIILAFVGTSFSDLSGQHEELLYTHSKLEYDYDLLQDNYDDLEDDYSYIQRQYQNQQQEINSLSQQLSELQEEYKELEEKNAELQSKLDNQNDENFSDSSGWRFSNSSDFYDSYSSVWLSAIGSKYHSIPDCGRMNPNTARQVSESSAISSGYGKCKNCF